MKIKIEVSEKEKKTIAIIALILATLIFIYNRKYLYILDAEFDDDMPSSIVLKTGFIFPKKTSIPMDESFTKKVYGYIVSVKRIGNNFDIYLDKSKVQTIYPAPYYDQTHKKPVGRVYLS